MVKDRNRSSGTRGSFPLREETQREWDARGQGVGGQLAFHGPTSTSLPACMDVELTRSDLAVRTSASSNSGIMASRASAVLAQRRIAVQKTA